LSHGRPHPNSWVPLYSGTQGSSNSRVETSRRLCNFGCILFLVVSRLAILIASAGSAVFRSAT
jgi:hypothetical protein